MSAGALRAGVVVVAAGSGDRLGASVPKALVRLQGRSLLAHALGGLAAAGLPPAVVVHTPGQRAPFAAAAEGLPVAAMVPGGATRTQSVAAGVAALAGVTGDGVEVVVVHDAARPLTPPPVIAAAVRAVREDPGVLAAAPGIPVTDTLKRTAGGRGPLAGREVVGTVDRTGLVGIQTPQVFPSRVLRRALAAVPEGHEVTDDLALVEQLQAVGDLQGRVVVVPGSVWARKVTYPADLALLELLATHADPAALDPDPGEGSGSPRSGPDARGAT